MAYSTTLSGIDFWLPSDFFTDDDILMAKENFNKHGLNTDLASNLCFPSEFPYEFGSPVESVVGSTTDSTESESDEDDLIAGLSRQLAQSTLQGKHNFSLTPQNLEKSWVLSGSPQSTLSAVGSWSGRSGASSNGSPNGPSQAPSPPTTPYGGNEDSWDLIYAAAGQVAKLKMNGDWPPNGREHAIPPRNFSPSYPSPAIKPPNTGVYFNQFQHVVQKQSSVWGIEAKELWPSQQLVSRQNRGSMASAGGDCCFGQSGKSARPLGLPQSAWPPLQVEHLHRQNPPQQHGGSAMRSVFLGGSDTGMKRECAGTGVFLPRRYGNLTESRKKPGCLPVRVVEALNKNMDKMTPGHVQPQIQVQVQPQPCVVNGCSVPDYNALMARRNALLAQRRQSIRPEGVMNHEIRLPQEWTY